MFPQFSIALKCAQVLFTVRITVLYGYSVPGASVSVPKGYREVNSVFLENSVLCAAQYRYYYSKLSVLILLFCCLFLIFFRTFSVLLFFSFLYITYGKGKDQPGKAANPADRGQLNKENVFFLFPFATENLVSRDWFGSPVPRQPAHSQYSG